MCGVLELLIEQREREGHSWAERPLEVTEDVGWGVSVCVCARVQQSGSSAFTWHIMMENIT